MTKSQNEDLENENARLHGEFSFGFFTKSVELNIFTIFDLGITLVSK